MPHESMCIASDTNVMYVYQVGYEETDPGGNELIPHALGVASRLPCHLLDYHCRDLSVSVSCEWQGDPLLPGQVLGVLRAK